MNAPNVHSRIVPLSEQITGISTKIAALEERVHHPHTEHPDRVLCKINFWRSVLKNLNKLKNKTS